jgi:hypothetical protein
MGVKHDQKAAEYFFRETISGYRHGGAMTCMRFNRSREHASAKMRRDLWQPGPTTPGGKGISERDFEQPLAAESNVC